MSDNVITTVEDGGLEEEEETAGAAVEEAGEEFASLPAQSDADKIRAAVRAVLTDGANQHRYPHQLADMVDRAIDNVLASPVEESTNEESGEPEKPAKKKSKSKRAKK